MGNALVDRLSRRPRMPRLCIYDFVERINEKGIKGVEEEKTSRSFDG